DDWTERRSLLHRMPGHIQRLAARLNNAYRSFTGAQARIAYDPDLVPPVELMRKEGIDVLEEWFRWAEEWSMLLRVYGRITRDSRILEIGCGLGRVAFPLRFIISSSGSYDGFDCSRQKIDFLQQSFHKTYSHFRFNWADIRNSRYNPAGEIDASDYRFPYPDESFDIVFAASVFTHCLPEAAINYFRESARVLKPGGRCLFSFFLLDNYRPGQPRPPGFSRPIFNFDHSYGDYGEDFSVVRLDNPEFMTAYSLRLIERTVVESGLKFLQPPVPGLWSGSFHNWICTQDLIVLRKSA
ncbi:MAG TPA: class I SAM-dependent methyltransferase, partial [Blastocatellia bacterium]|nr:class I SAM-dependent methyltransferase [Blastocatellia bacterium]